MLPRTATHELKGYNSQNAVVYYFRLTFHEENLCRIYTFIWLQQQHNFVMPKAKTHVVFVGDSYIARFVAAIGVHPDIPLDLSLCIGGASFVARRDAKVETISQMLLQSAGYIQTLYFFRQGVTVYATKQKMESKLQIK